VSDDCRSLLPFATGSETWPFPVERATRKLAESSEQETAILSLCLHAGFARLSAYVWNDCLARGLATAILLLPDKTPDDVSSSLSKVSGAIGRFSEYGAQVVDYALPALAAPVATRCARKIACDRL
jgi:hypothetical protein